MTILKSILLTSSQVKHDVREREEKTILNALGSIQREFSKCRERIKW